MSEPSKTAIAIAEYLTTVIQFVPDDEYIGPFADGVYAYEGGSSKDKAELEKARTFHVLEKAKIIDSFLVPERKAAEEMESAIECLGIAFAKNGNNISLPNYVNRLMDTAEGYLKARKG